MKNTQSAASTTRRVGGVPPLEPTTPTPSGWVSGIEPCPLIVVAIGQSSHSASASSSASAPAITTPPPQMISGFAALASSFAASRTAALSAA